MSTLKTNMFENALMQNSRFRCMTNGSQGDRSVVPQREAISYKSPVSGLQVVSQILSCNPSSVCSAATYSHPEFFGRVDTVKW